MYSIVITLPAEKNIRKLSNPTKNRVNDSIFALANDPRPIGAIKIRSEDGIWRIRVGDYRVGYSINDAAQVVTILRIGHRSDFYSN